MRARPILLGLLAAALAHGAAFAQAGAVLHLRGKFTTPTLSATPTPETAASPAGPSSAGASEALRSALGPTAGPPAPVFTDDDGTPLASPPATATSAPPPGRSFAGGLPSGMTGGFLAALPGLPTLRPVGDPAPLCRAECSKTRAFCAVTDDPGCDSHWAQCVAGCSESAAR